MRNVPKLKWTITALSENSQGLSERSQLLSGNSQFFSEGSFFPVNNTSVHMVNPSLRRIVQAFNWKSTDFWRKVPIRGWVLEPKCIEFCKYRCNHVEWCVAPAVLLLAPAWTGHNWGRERIKKGKKPIRQSENPVLREKTRVSHEKSKLSREKSQFLREQSQFLRDKSKLLREKSQLYVKNISFYVKNQSFT